MKTIEELKNAKSFTVEEWEERQEKDSKNRRVWSGGRKKREYKFSWNGFNRELQVSGDVFGNEKYKVLNELEVLFKVAQEQKNITVKLEGLLFEINNMVLKVNEK